MKRTTWFSLAEAVLAFIGTGIAGTLYWAHRQNVDLPCSTGGGCDLVNASDWSHIGPIPVSLIGTIGYIVLLFSAVIKLTSDSERSVRVLRVGMLFVAAGGFGYSWYLQYIAHFVIGAFCIYCFSSAITMTLLFFTLIAEIYLADAGSAPDH